MHPAPGSSRPSGAVFVLPVTTAGQQGPVASYVSTAGWASAGRRVVGASWIVTPNGVIDPSEARRRASRPELTAPDGRPVRSRAPKWMKTAYKDVRAWQRARRFRLETTGPWSEHEIAFVWQRHELFHQAGIRLARELDVPSVLFVPAPLVWEAEQWGVPRPGWARLAERVGESPSLTGADVVACGSDAVAEQVRRLGARDERILITPTGVDLDAFGGRADGAAARLRLGLDGRFVVGWVGSFRKFHAIERAVDAAAALDDVTLLLVGDGPERPRIEELAGRRGVKAVFTGTVSHLELPELVAAMDVGLLLARADEAFHYSPLKLAEYLASGVPVVAPRVPQLAARLHDGVDVVFVDPGDPDALVDAIARLRDDEPRRAAIGAAARQTAETSWSWDEQVRRVLATLAGGRPS
jgi:glycosyltransferase involved in cell wall biosynthesis